VVKSAMKGLEGYGGGGRVLVASPYLPLNSLFTCCSLCVSTFCTVFRFNPLGRMCPERLQTSFRFFFFCLFSGVRDCGGLNRYSPHRHMFLNAWPTGSGSIRRCGLVGGSVSLLGVDFEVSLPKLHPVWNQSLLLAA
jgi:hypothetical protein